MKIVLILSAPRCGSSCTAACIHLCGVCLGKSPTQVKDQYNAKGYFENQRVLRFNQQCLRKIGSSWNTPNISTPEQNGIMLAEHDALRQIITEEYDQDLCLIKDPRIAILWPLYRSVLDGLGMDHPMIVLKRNQVAAVKSMGRMAGLSVGRATKVYDGYYLLIDRMKKDCQFHDMDFEDLIENPRSAMTSTCDFLQIPYKQHDLVVDFIEEKLVRYK